MTDWMEFCFKCQKKKEKRVEKVRQDYEKGKKGRLDLDHSRLTDRRAKKGNDYLV